MGGMPMGGMPMEGMPMPARMPAPMMPMGGMGGGKRRKSSISLLLPLFSIYKCVCNFKEL